MGNAHLIFALFPFVISGCENSIDVDKKKNSEFEENIDFPIVYDNENGMSSDVFYVRDDFVSHTSRIEGEGNFAATDLGGAFLGTCPKTLLCSDYPEFVISRKLDPGTYFHENMECILEKKGSQELDITCKFIGDVEKITKVYFDKSLGVTRYDRTYRGKTRRFYLKSTIGIYNHVWRVGLD